MTTPAAQEMSEQFDRMLVDVLKNGQAVQQEDGTIERAHPSAAMLNVIRGRLNDLAKSAIAGGSPKSASHELQEEAKRRGLSYNGKPIGPIPAGDDPASDVEAVG